ncbi:MMPL family transporter [Plastoroseomonas hellenica]|uniref:MMPL family transporter n=1 Tax=Plastoroseomonas hellenica TaxID=2687306 RepID=UPI001BA94650|nr:MMPL family transporter [Plastoroseomonas hellenica]MBR0644590.1 MMPL family transporter [Plastoroseomonas hellenica]
MRRHLPLLSILLLLAAGLVLALRAFPLRGDLAAFLPRSDRAEAGFLLDELRSGAATTLLLAGFEGADTAELARISRAVGDTLRASGRFTLVANGAGAVGDRERELLFGHRYLLSPIMAPALFEEAALRRQMERLLDGLRSSAAPLLRQFGFADPTGAFLALARSWLGESRVGLRDGVWFSADGRRALLIARTRATGLDPDGQRDAAETLRRAFAEAQPGQARLLLSGPGIFAAEAAAAIRGDVEMISIASALLIAALLLWRYRSLAMLPVVAVPLLAGTLAGFLAVALAFGQVQGAAFGFGMTMLGVAVDYPILLLTQRRPQEPLSTTAQRIWPTLRLAALAAIIGMAAMLVADFPGLRQLGLFAAAGLLASALVTRHLLPRLAGGITIAARPLPPPALAVLAALPRGRPVALALIGLAALGLLAIGGPPRETDIAALSPVPEAARNLDAALRAELGAPDVGSFVVLRATDAEAALAASERAAAALQPLLESGRLTGLDHPARYLPSAATQMARRAMLPEPEALSARVEAARQGLPFRAAAFEPFLRDVARSRGLAPLTLVDLSASTALSARIAPLLAPAGSAWRALLLPAGLTDPAALRAALPSDALVVAVKPEMARLLDTASLHAAWAAGLGVLLVLGLLAAGLRSMRQALRTAAPIAGALLLTLAALALLGERLNLFHLAALLLLAGVGMDYALFMGRLLFRSNEAEEDARVLAAVLNCMLTTLLTFGLLAFCATPVLRSTGLTVALGVVFAFLLAATLVPRRPSKTAA